MSFKIHHLAYTPKNPHPSQDCRQDRGFLRLNTPGLKIRSMLSWGPPRSSQYFHVVMRLPEGAFWSRLAIHELGWLGLNGGMRRVPMGGIPTIPTP